jgi:hypothetical protein
VYSRQACNRDGTQCATDALRVRDPGVGGLERHHDANVAGPDHDTIFDGIGAVAETAKNSIIRLL